MSVDMIIKKPNNTTMKRTENKMKQTAVEWLVDVLLHYHNTEYSKRIIEQAKQIEKEQHGNTWDAAIKAHEDRGGVISRSICDFDEYYNGTYEVKNENRN